MLQLLSWLLAIRNFLFRRTHRTSPISGGSVLEGMVDRLDSTGSLPSESEIAFVRAYVALEPIPLSLVARLADPALIKAREEVANKRLQRDWPRLGQYRDENLTVMQSNQPVDLVFIGDSLTEWWSVGDTSIFVEGTLCRGISGQTSGQILLRFMADVVQLKPKAVHLIAGGNDIAGNTGPNTFTDYKNNMLTMFTLAKQHGIPMIVGSLLPANRMPRAGLIKPRERILQINAWLKEAATEQGVIFADYFSTLVTADGTLRADCTRDGIHPTSVGFARMKPVLMSALRKLPQ